ncbi:hypothetical protein J2T02_000452 [Chitinophaga terrae (ex Kim and Jung 2007)]|jgi:hypothetical protein|uniref:hypothetical protein n=1 Tax=Chitinophaga terrae (ex Kim and Jung 2007) TaxID=408074 RepID=UPI0027802804|nr:hypothetical protein [Chitinophaga terrae (ex Kim and Jung 2007)]MDQ0105359.1 hypothetical protein [Chitinophaga terrae (ex Kim and Jung 2007)]
MKKLSFLLTILSIALFSKSVAQVVPYDRKDWIFVGAGYSTTPPNYDILYYKILAVNADADRYASILQVTIQGDPNYYSYQGTFEIRIDKYEGTVGRFDGVEIRCISGNPQAALFYVFKNEIWVRSSYKWGSIFMRTIGDFANYSPRCTLVTTATPPQGETITANGFGVKCDFDNNKVYQLPYTDVTGSMAIGGTINAGSEKPKLSVNGLVAATKVKVTQTGWADFVFDPTYKLPELGEVEAYIKKNGRLQHIPSASEVNQDGIDLGNMNKLLLQKVEELTLYLLQQKKENDTLKMQNQHIVERLSLLENRLK